MQTENDKNTKEESREKESKNNENDSKKSDELKELSAKDHYDQFDSRKYLQAFYVSADEDEAMKIILFFLPGMIYRIPKGGDLLDLGAGPTVYVPMVFRNRVDQIYTSDYSPSNRQELLKWWKREPDCFDWSPIIDWIQLIEAGNEPRAKIEQETRSKLRAILSVDVHKEQSVIDFDRTIQCNQMKIESSIPSQFDIVCTIFCLEYTCETRDEYGHAVKNALKLLKPGGFLLYGGILHMTDYYFAGKKFRSFPLKKEDIFQCLQQNGMTIEGDFFRMICHDDIFMIVSKKS